MDVSIRDAISADAPDLSRFMAAVWHDTYDEVMGTEKVEEISSRWHSPTRLAEQISDNDAVFLIATDGDRLLGHAFAKPATAEMVMLHRLYIAPDMQRNGLGSMLLARVLERLSGFREMRLEVEEQNNKAVRFYCANGFVVAGRTEDCGGDSSQPALIMRRDL